VKLVTAVAKYAKRFYYRYVYFGQRLYCSSTSAKYDILTFTVIKM